jgi:hypothetical protein
MASSGNFATMNPLIKTSNTMTYSFGNLRLGPPSSSFSSTDFCRSSMVIPKDKKIYAEIYAVAGSGGQHPIAVATTHAVPAGSIGGDGVVVLYEDLKKVNGTTTSSWITAAAQGDVFQIAVDGATNKVWLGYNNTWGGSGNPSAGSNEAGTVNTSGALGFDLFLVSQGSTASTLHWNFGQDSTFGGALSAGGNADANGFGDFKYAPPTDFLALCSGNLSISDNIDPAQTDDEYPAKNFNVVTFTGNGSTNAVTGLGFQPDLIWGFTRDGSQDKRMIDSTRGGASKIVSNATNDEVTGTTVISAFGTDGFTANGGQFNNDNTKACGAWCWKGTGGTTASNADGDITSTIQANTNAGFSIVKFTSNNTANQEIGHGLGAVPRFILVKPLTGGGWSWWVYHYNSGTLGYLKLNNTDGLTTGTAGFGAHPSSSVFTMGSVGNSMPNDTSTEVISYVWADVEGSQKFGNYTGNGNADGPFIYTGFRPRMLFFKRKNSGHNWITFDTATKTFNPNDEYANWDTGSTSAQGASDKIDILSNGFKLRSTGSSFNGSGAEFIYGAWGDVPFKYNNTF